MTDLSPMACTLTVDDPQGTSPISDAYAVLVEAHLNFELQAVIGVFKIWRSCAAYQAGKQAMLTISVPIKPEDGGKDFFQKHGIDGAGCQLGPHIRNWCISRSPQLAGAVPVAATILERSTS